ncbi:MAG: AMIN domain-containing protein [Gammaproteobacteria bacterium]|uniref:N-acetylmuramoyl-L-alanine amidase n=2 Tax=Vreelandella venusta TaxID=44935 RepID=A0ABX2BAG6_9GAMM|nr:AMIN domain-containing protein [Halomonas venusta]MBR9924204.1 AMIN domain-containing protein [Gammaproteobacteria bacterium]NPT30276.1 N-acetylmuramoyl-L-alanine amidase [Halomonas venusta]QPI62778.1 N-acetylmuramoyl-L-alanine amidase [Halomonas venusta]
MAITSALNYLARNVSLGCVLMAAGASSLQAATVESMRLWAAPDHARLVFDLTAAANANVFSLDNPSRLVIDLDESYLDTDVSTLPLDGSAIDEVRTGVRDGGGLRVVLELNRDISPRHFSLPPNDQYGHRLVVDLEYPGESAVENPIDPIEAMIRDQEILAQRANTQAQAQSQGQVVAEEVVPPTVAPTATAVQPAQPHPQRDIIIAVDAGHGGEDPGAIGPAGTREKDVVLEIARRLAAEVNGTRGFKAVLIRDGDYYLGLRQRTQLARDQKADFFVSIHADAFTSPRPQGSSVYALSQRGATSETAQWLANSENRSDLIGGVDGSLSLRDKDQVLRGVLLDLTMTATLNDSLSIGGQVLDQLGRVNRLHKSRVEQAGFMVLKSPDIPSLLIELGFISNPDEERRLRDPAHQRALSTAIFSGLRDHFERNPPPASLLAWQRDNQRRPSGNEYRIRSGDTLSAIAVRHGVPVNQLKQANDINGDVIRVGQVLRIPRS